MKGVVAAGHPLTARAAQEVLSDGGNAFDAALSAMLASTVVEPVLASLGGGGFLLAGGPDTSPCLYDFFVQTPRERPTDQAIDFRPILADFGTTTQEFHIGPGAIATPGVAAGLFAVHRNLGRMPLRRIVEPALEYARGGASVNRLQASLFEIVAPIYTASPATLKHYGSPTRPGELVQQGEILQQPLLADALESLIIEGPDLFYRGEIAQGLLQITRNGGFLTRSDLEGYAVTRRKPLELDYRGHRILTNPPPSTGGILIAFALKLLEGIDRSGGEEEHLLRLIEVMDATQRVRATHQEPTGSRLEQLLDPALRQQYLEQIVGRPRALRGTTHISVIDRHGNLAGLTLSNGEGCGELIPGCGIMPNNMLGEEDLNPGGFHRWPTDHRMVSMMSPTLVQMADGSWLVTGSGGSNRIRSAILQTLLNRIDRGMALEAAVTAPRIHLEGDLLSIEGGFSEGVIKRLAASWPRHQCWDRPNLFFGGAHTVAFDGTDFCGLGDPRRDGVSLVAH